MKKIILFSLAIAAISFTSCKKCQTCTTKVTQEYNGVPQSSTSNEEYCGDEYDDAPAETTVTQNAGGVTQTVVITCEES